MNQAEQVAPGLNGLAQMQALMAAELRTGIGVTLGFRLVKIEEGRAVFEGEPGVHVYNPIGTVHGGYAAALLDSACGCAVHSKLAAGQGFTTIEIKIAYHKAITAQTGRVRAEGTIVSFGRRAAFAQATLTDMSGRLYASATSSLLVITP